jgi:hypothetical protein
VRDRRRRHRRLPKSGVTIIETQAASPHPSLPARPARGLQRLQEALQHLATGLLGAGSLWDLAGALGALPPWWPPPGYVLVALGIAAGSIAVLLRLLLTPRTHSRRPALTALELLAIGLFLGTLTLRGDAEIPPDPPLVGAQLVAFGAFVAALALRSRRDR